MAPQYRTPDPLPAELRRRPAGSHDEHFLARLERIALPEVEVALALYRDPELVRALLRPTRLPEGLSRVALSLDDPVEGPFLIVQRNGHFVTCLARGMRHDLTVVTREQLESLSGWIGAQRASLDEIGQSRRDSVKRLGRIIQAGDTLTREEFTTLARWQPLYLGEFWDILGKVSVQYDKTRHLLYRPWHQMNRERYESGLRALWRISWAASHLTVLAALHPERLLEMTSPEPSQLALASWATSRQGMICPMLRGYWAASRIGKGVVPTYLRQLQQSMELMTFMDVGPSLATIALRHPDQREGISEVLREPITVYNGLEVARHTHQWLLTLVEKYEESAGTYRKIHRDLGSRVGAIIAPHLFPRPEDVSEEVAWTLAANLEADPLNKEEDRHALLWLLPLMARIKAEDLYLPADLIGDKGWSMQRYELVSRNLRKHLELDQPTRTGKLPGRNEPCSCGSGKKYKRCCGA